MVGLRPSRLASHGACPVGLALALGCSLFLASCGGTSSSTPPRQGGSSAGTATSSASANGQARTATAGRDGAAGTIQAIIVQSVVARGGELADNRATGGTVAAVKQSAVAAKVGGVVVRVYHAAGDWVEREEPVVGLDDSQMRLSLQSARAALRSAQVSVAKAKAQSDLALLTVERDASLIKQNLIPQSQVDANKTTAAAAAQDYLAAQAAVEEASAQVAQAELNLANASILSPFPGQISAVNVVEGEYVGQNTSAFTLVSRDRELDFSVAPSDASLLAIGTRVQFTVGGQSHSARVSKSPSAPVGGVVPVVALFEGSYAPAYGTVGTVTFPITIARGVIVPIGALQTNENQNFVFTVVGGKAAAKSIRVLGETGLAAAVSGIDEGSQVILYPPPGLLDGSLVQAAVPTRTSQGSGLSGLSSGGGQS